MRKKSKVSERKITKDRTAQSRIAVLHYWFRSHQMTSCSREGSEMSPVSREPRLKTPFPLGHQTVTRVTLFPKRIFDDGKSDYSVWGNPAIVSSFRYLSPGPVRSGPADAETLVYGKKQQLKSRVDCIRRQLLSPCGHVSFPEFIFHFSLFFFYPTAPSVSFECWSLYVKELLPITPTFRSPVPTISTVLSSSWVWGIAVIILTGKLQYSEKNLPQCHFVHHKSYADCPGKFEVRLNNWIIKNCSQTKCILYKTLIRPILRAWETGDRCHRIENRGGQLWKRLKFPKDCNARRRRW
jgi:hypothetical protein